MYGVLMVPSQVFGDIPLRWDVNVYDEDGDFVTRAGEVCYSGDEVVYEDRDGTIHKFDTPEEASLILMASTVEMNSNKLN